ncbi:MAG TPA: hypothetical protein VED84_01485 [Acidimicrobiales bacterium]|nr:hypothetical protein [Acidimicrobiales bacterium]HYB91745.1 hypothetical protein [Candidatus Binataceae bacterium]
MSDWVKTLVSVAFGAVLAAALNYFFWKRQHREEVKSSEERDARRERLLEERELRRERARAVERLREVGGLLIEINRAALSGPNINQTEVTTTTYIEIHRLRREVISAVAAVRDVFPADRGDTALRLNLFEGAITEKVPLAPDSLGNLRSQLDLILDKLRADVSIPNK